MRYVAALSVFGFLLAVAMPGRGHESQDGTKEPPALFRVLGGSLAFIDHDGVRRGNEDFLGSHVLVSFGYTRCPTICPAR